MTRSSSTQPWLLILVAIAACEGGSCNGCGGDYLAEATETNAQVTRDFAGAVGTWQPCDTGDRFRLGDGLRTAAGATALLSMQPSGRVLVEENTTIRFESNDSDARRLELESGSVMVEATTTDLEVAAADSITLVRSGSRVQFDQQQGRAPSVHVRAGRAVIEIDGAERELKAGQRVTLDVGGAVVEETPAEDDLDPAPEPEPKGTPAGTPPGLHLPEDQAFEVRLPPGETATIHDPDPPSRVALTLPCERGGAVEVARGDGDFGFRQGRGRRHVSLTLPVGAFRYRIRCYDEAGNLQQGVRGKGNLRVVADAATRRLPAKAQRVRMDADGRNYRIQYSNRLPLFTFTWRDAPPADLYELHVELPNGHTSVQRRSKQAEVHLREGALGEGEYHYWFQTSDGRSSKPTTLAVTFQNQGRTAYLARSLEPSEEDGTLALRGGALAQSQVTVGNQRVELDAQGRFRTDIAPPAGGHVSVRVAHPSTGVHYYVRRVP